MITPPCGKILTAFLGSVWTQIAAAQYYFCSGYFLSGTISNFKIKKIAIGKLRTQDLNIVISVCPETVLAIGAHSSELGKTFALSLGDPKFCRLFKDSQLAAIRYVDFLFANKEVRQLVIFMSHSYDSYFGFAAAHSFIFKFIPKTFWIHSLWPIDLSQSN